MKTDTATKFVFILIFAGILSTAFAIAPKHGWLQTKDRYLLNENGNIVQLKGMSFFWSRPDWYNGASITDFYSVKMVEDLIKKWNCSVLRVAYAREDGDYGWNYCETVINACIDNGIYVIIDWHSHSAHLQEAEATTFFKQQAEKYLNTPNVIFELYNEPVVAGDAIENDGNPENARKTWAAIKPYFTNVTTAIRSTGSKNLIIFGTPYYCQHIGVAAGSPVEKSPGVPFENTAYSFHFYAASHGPNAYYVESEGGGMEATYLDAGINSIPVFVTEWGTTHRDGGEGGTHTYIDKNNTDWWFENYINEYRLSWCNWSVSNFQASSAFTGGIDNPSESGQIVKDYLADTKDEWIPEWITGKVGPAQDTLVDVPAYFHQASAFNRYWGSHAESTTVKFSYRDITDRRIPGTRGYTVLKVTPSLEDNWVAYKLNVLQKTELLILRYHAKDGNGRIEFLIDDTKVEEAVLGSEETWTYLKVPFTIGTGEHTFKLNFLNTEGEYYIEWFELTNNDAIKSTPDSGHNQKQMSPTVISHNRGYAVIPGSLHRFTGYSVLSANGQTIMQGPVRSAARTISVDNLPSGIWFIRLQGKQCQQILLRIPYVVR